MIKTTQSTVSILLSNGNGTFAPATSGTAGSGPLAIVDSGSNSFAILFGTL